MTEKEKDEIKLIVLETIIEIHESMSCYRDEGDEPLRSFIDEAIDSCRRLRIKKEEEIVS